MTIYSYFIDILVLQPVQNSYILYLLTMALGLNEHHQATVLNYMRFARYQRGQRLRCVDGCFSDLKDSRLNDSTYTIDEVNDMLDGLLAIISSEVESELINTAHTNVLMMRQVFQQAEKWHLKLQADISELENRELLEKIKDFEDCQFSGAKSTTDFSVFASKLEPMNDAGAAALLTVEIQRLTEENEKLKQRMKQVESQAVGTGQERSQMRQELERARREADDLKSRKRSGPSDGEVDDLRNQMDQLKSNLSKSDIEKRSAMSAMEGDLTSTKHELLKIQEMLELTEKELEKKVSQTAPFKNLKQMLQKKNDQLKDLRRELAKYQE